MILQLNPPIPVYVPTKGEGLALAMIDYGCEYHIMWVIGMHETGEIWTLPNPQVRMQKNISMNRTLQNVDKVAAKPA